MIVDDEGEAAERIAALANNVMAVCRENDAAWECACALVNVLGQLIRAGGPADEGLCEGRLDNTIKNLRACTRQSRAH